MESFFASLKKDLVHDADRGHAGRGARAAIFEYIEVFYNRQRCHNRWGMCPPRSGEQSE